MDGRVRLHWSYFTFMSFKYLILMGIMQQDTAAQAVLNNTLIGIVFRSFSNPDGALASGQCCDDPNRTAGSCLPNLCDTTFNPCGTRNVADPCDVFPSGLLPTTYDNDSFVFGDKIGQGKDSIFNLVAFKSPYSPGNTSFTITALELKQSSNDSWIKDGPMAEFTFIIDWLDPIYKNPPNYRQISLNDRNVELVVDVVSMCSKHFFTHDCSVFCKPDQIHFDCLDNGSISCSPGWEGPSCLDMTDYCPGNRCEHGSTCVPVLLNYTCTCPPGYAGNYCETPILTTTTPSSTITTATTTVLGLSTTRELTVMPTTTSSKLSRTNQSSQDDIGIIVGCLSGAAAFLSVGIALYRLWYRQKINTVTPTNELDVQPSEEQRNQDAANTEEVEARSSTLNIAIG